MDHIQGSLQIRYYIGDTLSVGALVESLEATATRMTMSPCHAKALAFKGALPPHPAPNTPPLALAWPPNVQDLIAELTDVVCTTVSEQVRLKVQAAMTGTHTTSAHRPLGPTTRETRPFEYAESTLLEMLRGPATLPLAPPMNQVGPDRELLLDRY